MVTMYNNILPKKRLHLLCLFIATILFIPILSSYYINFIFPSLESNIDLRINNKPTQITYYMSSSKIKFGDNIYQIINLNNCHCIHVVFNEIKKIHLINTQTNQMYDGLISITKNNQNSYIELFTLYSLDGIVHRYNKPLIGYNIK